MIPLEEAIRKMTSAVASRLSIRDRGLLREGLAADVVVFDPETIADRATFEKPHHTSVGVQHVFVNGTAVVRDGRHTGAKPGRIVRPGLHPSARSCDLGDRQGGRTAARDSRGARRRLFTGNRCGSLSAIAAEGALGDAGLDRALRVYVVPVLLPAAGKREPAAARFLVAELDLPGEKLQQRRRSRG